MSEQVYAGLTSQTIDVFLGDSSSTTGGGLTGLVYNTSGLTCYYRKGATGTATAITLATQTVGGAWSSGGFVQIDSTNMPGVYRFDIPNAAVDTEGLVTIYFRGATNLVPTALRLDCRAVRADNRDGDAIPSTSGGVTVQPLQSLVDERVSETTIQAYKNEAGWTIGPVVVTDASGNAVDLSAYTTLRLIIEDQYGTDLMTTTSVTVSGTGNNQWTATGTSAVTTTAPARHRWALRGYNTGVEVVLGRGIVTVTDAADE